jgi:hypothetical protein
MSREGRIAVQIYDRHERRRIAELKKIEIGRAQG